MCVCERDIDKFPYMLLQRGAHFPHVMYYCFVPLQLCVCFRFQAGMLAVRENRYIVLAKDFEKAYKTVIKKDEQEHEFYK